MNKCKKYKIINKFEASWESYSDPESFYTSDYYNLSVGMIQCLELLFPQLDFSPVLDEMTKQDISCGNIKTDPVTKLKEVLDQDLDIEV